MSNTFKCCSTRENRSNFQNSLFFATGINNRSLIAHQGLSIALKRLAMRINLFQKKTFDSFNPNLKQNNCLFNRLLFKFFFERLFEAETTTSLLPQFFIHIYVVLADVANEVFFHFLDLYKQRLTNCYNFDVENCFGPRLKHRSLARAS